MQFDLPISIPSFCLGRWLLCGALVLSAILGNTDTAFASSPQLGSILPRGVKAGGQHTLSFYGARLNDVEEIFLYDSGITVLEIDKVEEKQNLIKVKIKVDPNCRIGEHVAQVRTKNGISDFRSFFVGRLEQVAEVEPNNEIEQSQAVQKNITITGIVKNEDVDYFRIEGKKGERISVEVEALRLGFLFDPAIVLLDKDQFEIAASDDTPLAKQDAFFSVLLPQDGEYFIGIRESSFVGNNSSRYRMHVGNFPRPAAVYPAGGKLGQKRKFQFIDAYKEGQPVGATEQEIELPEELGFRNGIFFTDEGGTSPTPLPFRFNELPNHMEAEPNNSFAQEIATLQLPVAINGVVSEAGDLDYFKFTAKKGQKIDLRCFARQLGSGLDPSMNVYNADKKHQVGSDDIANKPDCYVQFDVPEDGDYFVRIFDHLKRGQPDFVYRLEIKVPKPKLTLGIKRNDRYSQKRQTIAVPQGSRFAVLVEAKRDNFAGEIELLSDNLPPGIKMVAPPMMSNLNLMPVVFEAQPDAELGGSLVDFRGRLKAKDSAIVGGFENVADFVLGDPNNSLYYSCKVDKLAFAVIEKLPFRLEIVQPKAPLSRFGSKAIKVIAHRDEGFDEPINIQFPFRTPGVGTKHQVVMKKGKSEVDYPINANGKAQLGKWPMYVVGNSKFKGTAWTSSQMAEIEVTEPFVAAKFTRLSIEQSQSTQLVWKLDQLKPFQGEAKVEVLGVPANIVVEPAKTITKDTQEIAFSIDTNENSPIGKHTGLFCRVTIPQSGEPIVATAGWAHLQINKPKPVKKKEVAAPAKKTSVAGQAKSSIADTNQTSAPANPAVKSLKE